MNSPSPRFPAIALALLALVPLARAENNTTNLIDGVVSNYAGATLNVGSTGTSNVLLVVNGGVFSNIGTAYIGSGAGASNNSALVAGPGSLWQVNGALILSVNTIGNSLTISNGGQVVVGTTLNVGSNFNTRGSILLDGGTLVATNGGINLGNSAGGGSMTVLGGGFLANGLFMGLLPFGTATNDLTILGGTNQVTGNTQVGANRSSYLTLDGGILLATNSGTSFRIANGGGSSGTVTVVSGTFMANDLTVGGLGGSQGLLAILGGTNNFTGTVTLGNNGSTVGRLFVGGGLVTVTNPNMVVGNSGTGLLTLSNGTFQASGMTLGKLSGSTGILQVAGGTLAITNAAGDATLVVGQAGLGIYTQLAGGVTVDRLVATNGANGLFNLNGGTFSILHGSTATTSIVIGRLAGSEATMTLAGGSNQWSSGFTLGAGAGSTGRLVIANGAALSAGVVSLLVGSNSVGSLLTTNATLVAGSMTVGSAAGSMGSWISLGASNRLTSTFTVASAAGSTGEVLLVNSWSSNTVVAIGGSGAGSLVSSNSTFLAGSMNVGQSSGSSGSWIDVGGSNAIQGPFFIAGGIGARGAVTLSNSFTSVGSALTMSSGTGSTGTLVVLGGTFLVPNGLEISRGIGALGQIFLDGGASFVLTNEITEVGVKGNGLLAVSNATYLGRDATLGSNAASVGTISIAGGDARFSGDVILGYKAGATGYVNFSSGLFTVTNAAGTAGLVVGRAGFGAYQQDGGDAIVDRLVATNGANSVFAFNGTTFTVLHGANVVNGQTLAIGTNGPASATMRLLGDTSSAGDLLVGGYGTLLVSNATLNVAGWVTNSGTIKLDRATVTYQKPVQIDGGFMNDLSLANFKTNLVVGPSGWLAGATGGTFALEKDFILQSTNFGPFNLNYSTLLFTNGPNHTFDLSGSGAKDVGGITNFADVANNFAIGQLNLAFGDTLTLTGTKSGALTNALYVGAFNVQGLGTAPYLTNSFLDVSNTLASILSLPNINLYFDPTDARNGWLVNNMPDGGYNFWGGGALSGAPLAIPEPSLAALALLGAGVFVLFRGRAGAPRASRA